MNNVITIGAIVKRYIKMRRRTAEDVAMDVGVNYKTFSGVLNGRSEMKATLLLELATILDMDLAWMSQFFDKRKNVSCLEADQISRMSQEFRQSVQPSVLQILDEKIYECPSDTNQVKREMVREYSPMFYLLDVLLPEEYAIKIISERGREKCYCIPLDTTGDSFVQRGRNAVSRFREGNEMLLKIIEERKEFLRR